MTLHVAAACDEAFAPFFASMLLSATIYSPQAEYWLLDCGIEPETLRTLRFFAADLRASLRIVPVVSILAEERFSGLAGPRSQYARLLLPELLPVEVLRCIYLDCDITVAAPLEELAAIDLRGHALGGVCDTMLPDHIEYQKLRLQPDHGYINSGVLLLDLDQWRSGDLQTVVLHQARSIASWTHFGDQTALYLALGDRIALLPPRWNYLTLPDRDLIKDIAIFHHGGPEKDLTPKSPFFPLQRFHRGQTPFPLGVKKKLSRRFAEWRRWHLARLGWPKYRRYLATQLPYRLRNDAAVATVKKAKRSMPRRWHNLMNVIRWRWENQKPPLDEVLRHKP